MNAMDVDEIRRSVTAAVKEWDDEDVAVRVETARHPLHVTVSSRHPSTYYNQWVELTDDGTVHLPAPDDGFTSLSAKGTTAGTAATHRGGRDARRPRGIEGCSKAAGAAGAAPGVGPSGLAAAGAGRRPGRSVHVVAGRTGRRLVTHPWGGAGAQRGEALLPRGLHRRVRRAGADDARRCWPPASRCCGRSTRHRTGTPTPGAPRCGLPVTGFAGRGI